MFLTMHTLDRSTEPALNLASAFSDLPPLGYLLQQASLKTSLYCRTLQSAAIRNAESVAPQTYGHHRRMFHRRFCYYPGYLSCISVAAGPSADSIDQSDDIGL